MALSRSLIELCCDAIAVRLTHSRQTLALREVLTEQAVEVFVAAPFPRMVWVRKVAPHAHRLLQCLVSVKLGAVVPGDGLERQATVADRTCCRAVHCQHGAVWQPQH